MNILFLTIVEFDSINKKGIYTDLMRCFRRHGHNLYIVSPVEKRKNKKTGNYVEDGVNYLKVKTGNITKTNFIEKTISTLRVELQYLNAIKTNFDKVKFDLIIYSTPPITFAKIIAYLKKEHSATTYLLLKDIFPQNAVDLEIFSKKSIPYFIFRRKEKKLYSLSDYVGCMSPANVEFTLNNNPKLDYRRVEECPNSFEVKELKVYDKQIRNEIRDKYGIPRDKCVFIYGGSLGKPQGIDFLISCIEKNEFNKESFILVVGDGTEYNRLKKEFESRSVKNSLLLRILPQEDYDKLVLASDVGLIFLDKRFTIPNFPSRLLSYMDASLPVIAATDKNTDVGSIIEKGGFGYWCESVGADEFNQLVNMMSGNREKLIEIGAVGRKYLAENYSTERSYEIIMSHFKNQVDAVGVENV